MNETVPKTPPSPPGLPLVGHAYAYASDPLGFVERTVEEYGPITALSTPTFDAVLLADPEAIEHVLARNHDNYRKGEFQKKEFDGLLGDGLLVSEADQWERQHEQILPAFYPGRIAEYAETMVERTEPYLDRWAENETLTLTDALPELTLDILGSVLFGTDLREATAVRDAAAAVTERFTPDGRVPFYVPDWVPTPRNRRYLRAVDRLDSFVADLVASRRRETDSSASSDDLLSTLLDSGMDDEGVRDQLVTFLIAGHETTALALTYTLYLLGNHPDAQASVAAEVAELDGRPQLGDDLPRTDRAIREAMRLYPPAPLLMREAIEDDVVGGFEIPEGALVLCSQWATHRRSAFFENPEVFRPERWAEAGDGGTDGDGDSDCARPDYAYFPFGGGPRACIGRRFALFEMRLVLASLLRRFEVRTRNPDELNPVPAMTLAPGDDVVVELRERD
ncbi:cytochrome P450 [Halorussus halophilus]|uniref:cytochrome P450 n=1 Tax=Halorussus halophilus TaxID=2650975 RepID=UPI001300F188|nr:cytochrome P450 [Halorussus halophilus]